MYKEVELALMLWHAGELSDDEFESIIASTCDGIAFIVLVETDSEQTQAG